MSAFKIVKQKDGTFKSVFPREFKGWSREHDTCQLAYDYMRDDAKVESYIEYVPLKTEDA